MATSYSQRDSEWAEDGLGVSLSPTMGQAGCLVTAMASVVTDMTEHPASPGYLNGWLRENSGFVSGNLFVYGSVAPLGLKVVELIRCQETPAPIEKLAKAVADEDAVIIQVDSTPGGAVNSHFVRLISVDEQDGLIMDPWQLPGKEVVKLSKYFAANWTPERAIFIAAIYRATPAGRDVDPDAQLAWEHQPALCLRPARRRRSRR